MTSPSKTGCGLNPAQNGENCAAGAKLVVPPKVSEPWNFPPSLVWISRLCTPPPTPPPLHKPGRAQRRSLLLFAGGLILAAGIAVAAVQLSESPNPWASLPLIGT